MVRLAVYKSGPAAATQISRCNSGVSENRWPLQLRAHSRAFRTIPAFGGIAAAWSSHPDLRSRPPASLEAFPVGEDVLRRIVGSLGGSGITIFDGRARGGGGHIDDCLPLSYCPNAVWRKALRALVLPRWGCSFSRGIVMQVVLQNLSTVAQLVQALAAVSIFVAMWGLRRQIRQQNLSSFFYLHQYLSAKEYSNARKLVRTELFKKPYANWTADDKQAANDVCASYDQAAILLAARVLDSKSEKHFLKSSWGRSICHQYETLKDFLDDRQTPAETGREFFRHFGELYVKALRYHTNSAEIHRMSEFKIVSGGQTGVDRAALDVAMELGIDYGGWCPQGGLAEDHPNPPGLLTAYPKLKQTPTADVSHRTRWNVRDADATIILVAGSTPSKGTDFTEKCAQDFERDCLKLDLDRGDDLVKEAKAWIASLGAIRTLNVAGPRESEAPGVYEKAKALLRQVLR